MAVVTETKDGKHDRFKLNVVFKRALFNLYSHIVAAMKHYLLNQKKKMIENIVNFQICEL